MHIHCYHNILNTFLTRKTPHEKCGFQILLNLLVVLFLWICFDISFLVIYFPNIVSEGAIKATQYSSHDMHLDQNCTKNMLMIIVICTIILRKFYNTYFFRVSPNICIDICIDVHPTSALICVNINRYIYPTTASICIDVCIIYIHLITASPDPLHRYSTISTQNMHQYQHHWYSTDISITRPLHQYPIISTQNLHRSA